MKKAIIALVLFAVCGVGLAGQLELPVEQVAFPVVQQGNYLVCIWDDNAGQWVTTHRVYDHSGSYSFQVPSWGKWYWIGLWDQAAGQYVFGKWIGHFITN